MLTIAIPTRNHAVFLEPLLRTLLTEIPEIAKVLVGNDASSDSTAEVLSTFGKDEKMAFFSNEKQLGAVATLSKLFVHVATPYVMFLSSDDYVYPEQISKLCRVALEKKTAVCFGKYKIEKNKNLIDLIHPGWAARKSNGASDFASLLGYDHYIFFGSTIFEVASLPTFGLNGAPFDLRLNELVEFDGLGEFRAHDWNLAIYLASKFPGRIEFLDEYCSVFRVVENQLSSDERYAKTGRAALEMALLLLRYMQYFKDRSELVSNDILLNQVRHLFSRKKSVIEVERCPFYESGYRAVLNAADALIA